MRGEDFFQHSELPETVEPVDSADFVGWRDDEHHISIISLNIATRHAAFASTGAQLNNHGLASNFQGRKDRKWHEEKRSPSNPGCCSIVS